MKPNALHKLKNNYQLTNDDRQELLEYIDELKKTIKTEEDYKQFCRHQDRLNREQIYNEQLNYFANSSRGFLDGYLIADGMGPSHNTWGRWIL